jgi:hypothetical protein
MHFVQTTGRLLRSKFNGMEASEMNPYIEALGAEPDFCLGVHYLGHLQIAVSGRFTGNLYRFSPVQPVQQVQARDAFYLLESGLFGIAK